MILYIGLAMISFGLLITFLGLGEGTSGFKTTEMKLIGPSLVGCGVFFAVLRILFCTVPSCCRSMFACCCCRNSEDAEKLVQVDEKVPTILISLVMSPPLSSLICLFPSLSYLKYFSQHSHLKWAVPATPISHVLFYMLLPPITYLLYCPHHSSIVCLYRTMMTC